MCTATSNQCSSCYDFFDSYVNCHHPKMCKCLGVIGMGSRRKSHRASPASSVYTRTPTPSPPSTPSSRGGHLPALGYYHEPPQAYNNGLLSANWTSERHHSPTPSVRAHYVCTDCKNKQNARPDISVPYKLAAYRPQPHHRSHHPTQVESYHDREGSRRSDRRTKESRRSRR